MSDALIRVLTGLGWTVGRGWRGRRVEGQLGRCQVVGALARDATLELEVADALDCAVSARPRSDAAPGVAGRFAFEGPAGLVADAAFGGIGSTLLSATALGMRVAIERGCLSLSVPPTVDSGSLRAWLVGLGHALEGGSSAVEATLRRVAVDRGRAVADRLAALEWLAETIDVPCELDPVQQRIATGEEPLAVRRWALANGSVDARLQAALGLAADGRVDVAIRIEALRAAGALLPEAVASRRERAAVSATDDPLVQAFVGVLERVARGDSEPLWIAAAAALADGWLVARRAPGIDAVVDTLGGRAALSEPETCTRMATAFGVCAASDPADEAVGAALGRMVGRRESVALAVLEIIERVGAAGSAPALVRALGHGEAEVGSDSGGSSDALPARVRRQVERVLAALPNSGIGRLSLAQEAGQLSLVRESDGE